MDLDNRSLFILSSSKVILNYSTNILYTIRLRILQQYCSSLLFVQNTLVESSLLYSVYYKIATLCYNVFVESNVVVFLPMLFYLCAHVMFGRGMPLLVVFATATATAATTTRGFTLTAIVMKHIHKRSFLFALTAIVMNHIHKHSFLFAILHCLWYK